MNSKTIILSSPNQTHCGRGIMSIYIEDDLLKCKLRLYNTPKLTPHCKLGIYHQQQVYSANLLEKNGAYESSFVGDFNLEENFYIALINTAQNNDVIISGGTYAGYYFNMDNEFKTNSQPIKEETQSIKKKQTTPAIACTETTCPNCENCIYKQQFYANENSEPFTTIPEETALNTPQEQNTDFKPVFTQNEHIPSNNPTNTQNTEKTQEKQQIKPNMQHIIEQFNYVFKNYPLNNEINALIPNGKFASICENQEEYSIGVIYNNEQIKYLCYAVKSTYNTDPPQEIGTHHQWLPLDPEDPLSDGYYIVFQDTTDLKILDLN